MFSMRNSLDLQISRLLSLLFAYRRCFYFELFLSSLIIISIILLKTSYFPVNRIGNHNMPQNATCIIFQDRLLSTLHRILELWGDTVKILTSPFV